jgi:hypothetical protein
MSGCEQIFWQLPPPKRILAVTMRIWSHCPSRNESVETNIKTTTMGKYIK